MREPEVLYTDSGGGRVGYRVFGDGDTPVVVLHAALATIGTNWEHPLMLRLWRLYARFARVVDFDQRGCGVSDPLAAHQLGSLEEWAGDVVAVMDAAGMDRATLAAGAEGVAAAITVAALHPERVDRLVLVDGFAKGTAGDDYPFGPSPDAIEAAAEFIRQHWGTGRCSAIVAPELADDLPLLARTERQVASPTVAADTYRAFSRLDVRPRLSAVRAPALVATTSRDPDAIARSRHLAENITDALHAEYPGSAFFWGHARSDEIFRFMAGESWRGDQRSLATVVFTDIVGSTDAAVSLGDARWRDVLDAVDAYVAATVSRAGGRVVKGTGDGHLIEFSSPSAALHTALAFATGTRSLGVLVRTGVHTGEVERRADGDLAGIGVHVAARIMGLAGAGEVLVSHTVRELVRGSEIGLVSRGAHHLRGLDGEWEIYAATGARAST